MLGCRTTNDSGLDTEKGWERIGEKKGDKNKKIIMRRKK
jgi:hypothetical protein